MFQLNLTHVSVGRYDKLYFEHHYKFRTILYSLESKNATKHGYTETKLGTHGNRWHDSIVNLCTLWKTVTQKNLLTALDFCWKKPVDKPLTFQFRYEIKQGHKCIFWISCGNNHFHLVLLNPSFYVAIWKVSFVCSRWWNRVQHFNLSVFFSIKFMLQIKDSIKKRDFLRLIILLLPSKHQ